MDRLDNYLGIQDHIQTILADRILPARLHQNRVSNSRYTSQSSKKIGHKLLSLAMPLVMLLVASPIARIGKLLTKFCLRFSQNIRPQILAHTKSQNTTSAIVCKRLLNRNKRSYQFRTHFHNR